MDELFRHRCLNEKLIQEMIRNGPDRYRSAYSPAKRVRKVDAPESLTPREAEVLSLLAQGLSDTQIANRLIISPNTVHAHLRRIYSKLGVSCRTAAVRIAFESGLG